MHSSDTPLEFPQSEGFPFFFWMVTIAAFIQFWDTSSSCHTILNKTCRRSSSATAPCLYISAGMQSDPGTLPFLLSLTEAATSSIVGGTTTTFGICGDLIQCILSYAGWRVQQDIEVLPLCCHYFYSFKEAYCCYKPGAVKSDGI